MRFTKMQGCGNDYIYVDVIDKPLQDADQLAIKLSDRHFGIGADGLILIAASDVADYQMIMYNADGSRGEMCGNGIRCVGKFVYDKGLTDKKSITVETLAGIKTLTLNVVGRRVESVRVDMGSPILEASKIPVISTGDKMIGETIVIDDHEYTVDCISMGNPHCVVRMDEDVRNLDLCKIGPKFESYKAFPERINTEFVNIIDRDRIRMRVWERGSGETLACGTGASASAVSCIINGYTNNSVDVELLGGTLNIEYEGGMGSVFMTGSAESVYEGEIDV